MIIPKLDAEVTSLSPETVSMLRAVKNRLVRIDGVLMAVLFGSYSKGCYNADSDIDIALFADGTKNADYRDIFGQAITAIKDTPEDVQVLVFDIAQLDEPVGILEEIVSFGLDITGL